MQSLEPAPKTSYEGELTQYQGSIVVELIEFQQTQGGEVEYQFYEGEITQRGTSSDNPIVEITNSDFHRYRQCEYLTAEPSSYQPYSETTWQFKLTQKAVLYSRHMQRHRTIRWIIETYNSWRSDFRSIFVAAITSLIVAYVVGILGP